MPSRPAPSPHHCFHVFAVYPWLGLLRTGVVDEPLHILDQCRTTPARRAGGRGRDGRGARAAARSGTAARCGSDAREPRTVRWRDGGLGFVAAPQPGDCVSLHWDFVCDRLTRLRPGPLPVRTVRRSPRSTPPGDGRGAALTNSPAHA